MGVNGTFGAPTSPSARNERPLAAADRPLDIFAHFSFTYVTYGRVAAGDWHLAPSPAGPHGFSPSHRLRDLATASLAGPYQYWK